METNLKVRIKEKRSKLKENMRYWRRIKEKHERIESKCRKNMRERR